MTATRVLSAKLTHCVVACTDAGVSCGKLYYVTRRKIFHENYQDALKIFKSGPESNLTRKWWCVGQKAISELVQEIAECMQQSLESALPSIYGR